MHKTNYCIKILVCKIHLYKRIESCGKGAWLVIVFNDRFEQHWFSVDITVVVIRFQTERVWVTIGMFNSKKTSVGPVYWIFRKVRPKKRIHDIRSFPRFSAVSTSAKNRSPTMKNTEGENRSRISAGRLESRLRIVTTSIDPDVDSLFSDIKRFQILH